jgi:translation initiation factor IF-3
LFVCVVIFWLDSQFDYTYHPLAFLETYFFNFLPIKTFRINHSIKSPTIRLIGHEGEQHGIMGLSKAKAMAKEVGQDLVEVSPTAHPPVCKIMDYGKHLYKQKKQDQAQKKAQKQTEVKVIRIGIRTEEHDLNTKVKRAEKFLKERNLVKISLIFKGREAAHAELGYEKLKQLTAALEEVAVIDTPPKRQGNNLMMILAPIK